jgi:hypothetical protein
MKAREAIGEKTAQRATQIICRVSNKGGEQTCKHGHVTEFDWGRCLEW